MLLFQHLLSLPPTLLAFIAGFSVVTKAQELQWPYNLPSHVKYFPEDEPLIKRGVDVQQRLQHESPVGVKKMSDDPGEKFHYDYWSFEANPLDSATTSWFNTSNAQLYEPSIPLHSNESSRPHVLPRHLRTAWLSSLFDKRDFQCPTGTSSCTTIGRPNSCCQADATCQLIQDTGLGDVGCCPNGEACAGSVSTCDAGYTSCPNNPGGGCCLPDYGCFDVGCVQTATATVLVTPTPSLSLSAVVVPSMTTATSSSSLSAVIVPSMTIVTSIVVVTFVPPSSSSVRTSTSTTIITTLIAAPLTSTTVTTTTTRTTISNTLSCSSGYRSCASSLGGGCCPTDRECGSTTCPPMTSSGSLVAPARPTTGTTTTTITDRTTSTSTSPTSVSGCPTGFYACSAYYQGGCCQIGRDCAMTSCPTTASTILLSTNSITAVAPTGSGITAPGTVLTGACATGWQSCAQSVGGGCCPSGYACGTSCTATATGGGGSQVGKEAPNGAEMLGLSSCMLMGALSLSIALGAGFVF